MGRGSHSGSAAIGFAFESSESDLRSSVDRREKMALSHFGLTPAKAAGPAKDKPRNVTQACPSNHHQPGSLLNGIPGHSRWKSTAAARAF